MQTDGTSNYYFSDPEKAECLNDYFASISTINDDNTELPNFQAKCVNKLTTITCTPNEI